MKTVSRIQSLRLTIKSLLKKHGYTYAELGKQLKLSEASVKRLMTEGDLSLQRLEVIADWLGLTVDELMDVSRNTPSEPYPFSEAQEHILADNPRALYLLLLLGAGLTFGDILKRWGKSRESLQKELFALDKAGLIELVEKGRVRIKARGPYRWISKGVLEKKYRDRYLKLLSQLPASQIQQGDLQQGFELYLTFEVATQMQEELQAVYEKYRNLSRSLHESADSETVVPYTGLILLKSYDLWRTLLEV